MPDPVSLLQNLRPMIPSDTVTTLRPRPRVHHAFSWSREPINMLADADHAKRQPLPPSRWSQVQQDLAVSGVGRPLSPLTPAISALIQASSRLLPPTLRNISVAAANGGDGGALVQGPLRVVQGLSQVADPGGAPVVECGFHGPEPPPFVSSLRHWEQVRARVGNG